MTQRLIPLAEAVERGRVSDKTIRRWIKAGRLTGYRRGPASGRGRLFVDPDELDAQIQPMESCREQTEGQPTAVKVDRQAAATAAAADEAPGEAEKVRGAA